MLQRDRILIVDDEVQLSNLLQDELQETEKYAVDLAYDGVEAINLIQKNIYDVILLDIKLPRVGGLEVLKFIQEKSPDSQVIILSRYSDVKTVVESIRLGAYDFIGKPYDIDELFNAIERAIERKKLLIKSKVMESELARIASTDIIGESPFFKKLLDDARRVAAEDSYVLIEGASGTGKELIAHLIHKESPRKNYPFVAVNCASIPDTLIESEIFGHEKGAFTDAHTLKPGLVEVANGGTLFLDEIGDISMHIQPKLLRFLETGNFRRVGGTSELHVDVRVISATNKDLLTEVKNGKFRQDLLYRINVVTLKMPLLRERKEDIPLLAEYFLKKKSKEPKLLSQEALQILLEYDWPGNVRELEHVIEGAIILSNGNLIHPQDLKIAQPKLYLTNQLSTSEAQSDMNEKYGKLLSMDEVEKIHIEHVLKLMNGNRSKTAEALGISQKALYLKIKKYGIKVD
ncbi:MAG: C4-dicarboxylate transport transcriptional regulatory protein [Ignavibacteriae bacterium]|nr:MAG: C4-dicarboxylate transport transcriptional regulatory protein [Ignavibacteriota bacterium]